MYREIIPSVKGNNIIDSFWSFSSNQKTEEYKILPDTCTDFIFDLASNKSFVSGVMTKFQLRELPENTNLIGVRLKTERLSALTKLPLYEVKNKRIDLAQMLPTFNNNISCQLNDLSAINDKLTFLENTITIASYRGQQKHDDLILSVVENIRKWKGNVNMKEVAQSNHISLRQLERRFKRFMGITIKEFSNIVRFSYTQKRIRNAKNTSLLSIAFDMGFYDHSHMNNEFKRIAGENPSFFR